MEIHATATKLDGVVIIDTEFFSDTRGFFIESYHRARFAEAGIEAEFVQDNHSRSAKNVLRGIHYQDMTAPMGKLVRCTAGSILDVAVDLRSTSRTFGEWVAVELDEVGKRQLFIPSGFGHAFYTLSDFADVQYKCTGYYAPSSEGSVAWNDPEIAIQWPVDEPLVSARDAQGSSFATYRSSPAFT